MTLCLQIQTPLVPLLFEIREAFSVLLQHGNFCTEFFLLRIKIFQLSSQQLDLIFQFWEFLLQLRKLILVAHVNFLQNKSVCQVDVVHLNQYVLLHHLGLLVIVHFQNAAVYWLDCLLYVF